MKHGSRRLAVGALFALILAALGLLLPVYWVYLLSTVAVSALIARSIGLLTNQVGIVTLCQMSFAAIGGWVASALALASPAVWFPAIVLAAGVVTAPVGIAIGAATARIRGIELAVLTLGFAAALDLVLRQGSFPGVGSGTPVIPAAPFDEPRLFFVIAWVFLIVSQFVLVALDRSRHGLGWLAVRQSERAAASIGVRVGRAKTSAFGLGAFVAGIAGGLMAGQYGLLTSAVFSPITSMVHLATAILCGASVFGGAALAGIFSAFVPELLRRLGLPLDLASALLAIGAFDVLRRRRGGLAEQWTAMMQDRAFRSARKSCALVVEPESAASSAASPAGVDTFDSTSSAALLETRDLTVDFGGTRALDRVGISVARGEVHALIGANGSGKSTFIDAVTGFVPISTGEIHVSGTALGRHSVADRALMGIRRTFQQSRVIESLTLDSYLRLASRGGSEDQSLIAEVHEFFGLPDGALPIRLMDVGSRRVLEIAATLVAEPQVILLDEPAAGLDETTSLALAERIRRIPQEFGPAVLLVEHDLAFVRASSLRVTVLDEGWVAGTGSIAETLDDPHLIAVYLGTEAAG